MPDHGLWYITLASGMNYIVNVSGQDIDMLHCSETAWVASTGCRLGKFLRDGPTSESEIELIGPFKFNRSLITGIGPWGHAFPDEV